MNEHINEQFDGEKNDKIQMLMAISDQAHDAQIAAQYLEMFNWDVEQTVHFLLDQTPLQKHDSNEIESNHHPQDITSGNAFPYNAQQPDYEEDEGLINYDQYDQALRQQMPRPELNSEQRKYEESLVPKEGQSWPSYLMELPFQPLFYVWDYLTYNYKTGQQFINTANSLLNHQNGLKVDFCPKNFQICYDTIEHSSKMPSFVYIHNTDWEATINSRIVNELLDNVDLTSILNQNFKCFGILNSSSELDQISELVQGTNFPCFLIFRKDKFQKNESLAVISQQTNEEIDIFTISQLLNGAIDTFLTKTERDKIFISTYKNKKAQIAEWKLMNNQDPNAPDASLPYAYEEESIYDNVPNLPANLNQPEMRRNPSNQGAGMVKQNTRDLVSEQNKQYQDMVKAAKEQKKKQEEIQLMEKIKESEEQMKLVNEKQRRESIEIIMSEEPGENEANVFNCAFRLPNGKRINRRFYKSEKVQILQDYISIQDDIGFEEDDDRSKFSILSGFPRKAIEGLGETLQEKFGAKKQELFIVNIVH